MWIVNPCIIFILNISLKYSHKSRTPFNNGNLDKNKTLQVSRGLFRVSCGTKLKLISISILLTEFDDFCSYFSYILELYVFYASMNFLRAWSKSRNIIFKWSTVQESICEKIIDFFKAPQSQDFRVNVWTNLSMMVEKIFSRDDQVLEKMFFQ